MSDSPPRTRSADVHIADLTMMVRVPGQPAAVRVYTEAESDDAARYAAETGGRGCETSALAASGLRPRFQRVPGSRGANRGRGRDPPAERSLT